jgi:hypothetical protein
MTDTKLAENDTDVPGDELASTYIRWGGLAAMLGPLLVLVANAYLVWRDFGPGPESVVEAATTTPYLVFGGVRLLGGTLLVFGLVALYAHQVEAVGRLGVVGFVVGTIGTVLLTGSAWFQLFVVPAMATEVPAFAEAARAAQVGQWTTLGLLIPILAQAIGWVVFGIATYRARVFPRWVAAGLVVGALLLFVPIQGLPVVFQLAVASMGFLLFSGRLETPAREPDADRSQSESIGG